MVNENHIKGGLILKLNEKHKSYQMALRDKDMLPVIAYGSAGTSKTYSACEAAVEWLNKNNKSKVLVTRPNVSFAQGNGYLPGTEQEKMEPWVRPIRHSFKELGMSVSHMENLEKNGRITYMPLEFIQGLTFDNTFIILDECQNMTAEQLRVFLTRTGKWSKVVLCGDVAQTSPKFRNSGLQDLIQMVDTYDLPVHTIEFTQEDIVRSGQCRMWIRAYEQWDNGQHPYDTPSN